jgi:hypothetical protein
MMNLFLSNVFTGKCVKSLKNSHMFYSYAIRVIEHGYQEGRDAGDS